MCEVHRAVDLRAGLLARMGLGNRAAVAVKVMRPGPSREEQQRQRFVREGRLLDILTCEHTTKVFEVGELETMRLPFMVMELLVGVDLARLRSRRAIPWGEAADYVLQACRGLAHAHRLGIIHRDIKMSNLFLAYGGGKATVKVLDFGISKRSGENTRGLTNDQVILGSPAYMSPEQIRHPASVDARTDIWSLGVVLHRLVSGDFPFEAACPALMFHCIAKEAPRSLRELCPEVPEQLEQIVLRCLQKERAKRYRSVAELAEDLARFCAPNTKRVLSEIAQLIAEDDGDGDWLEPPTLRQAHAQPGEVQPELDVKELNEVLRSGVRPRLGNWERFRVWLGR